MPDLFVKMECGFLWNPKVNAVSLAAQGLYLRACLLAKQALSDGIIHRTNLPIVAPNGYPDGSLEELEEANLLTRLDDDRWEIVGFLERNMSSDQVAEKRSAQSEGGQAGALKRWHKAGKHEDSPVPGCPTCDPDGDLLGGPNGTPVAPQYTETETETETGEAHARGRETNPNGTPRTWDQDWRKVSAAVRGGSNRPIPENITGRARAAVQRLGGMRQLGSLDPKSAKFDFRDAWKEVGHEQTV